MKATRSLRLRFVLAFAFFGCVLTAAYGIFAWGAIDYVEDVIMERWLEAEADAVRSNYAAERELTFPNRGIIRLAKELESLPEELQGRVPTLGVGQHELPGSGVDRWRLQVVELSDERRIFLYFNESPVEVSEAYEAGVPAIIVGSIVIVSLFGVFLGMVTTNRVISPLRRLTRAVSQHKPEKPLPQLRRLTADDELGQLAAQMERAMEQVAASARQEQLFGRYTSHELRSSLAVACGVAELLEDLDDPRLTRPLGRLDRALQDMEGIVETCLWLAHSQSRIPEVEELELRPVVEEVVERLGDRICDGVELRVDIAEKVLVTAPASALRMVVGNLLSNALRHTTQGFIVLSDEGGSLVVSDTGPGIPEEVLVKITEPYVRGPGDGHGLGLAIVNGLCARLGWSFEVTSEVGEGTQARVEFGSGPG